MWTLALWTGLALGADVDQLLAQGRITEALKLAAAEVTANPGDVEVEERFIDILVSLGRGAVAREQALAGVAKTPTNADRHYLLGRATPDDAGSMAAYEAALRYDPSHARANMGAGSIYLARGDWPSAQQAFARAVDLDGSLEEAWMGMVRAHLGMNQKGEALSSARAGLDAVVDATNLALLYADLAPAADALPVLQEAAAAAPENPALHLRLSEAWVDANQPAKARQAVALAARLGADPLRVRRVTRAAEELVSGRLDVAGHQAIVAANATLDAAAVTALADVVRRYPRSAVAALALAGAARAQGDVARATSELRKVLTLFPGDPDASAVLGAVLLSAGDAAAARPLLDAARAVHTWDVDLWLAACKARAALGQRDAALALFGETAEQFPASGRAVAARPAYLLELGRAEEAYEAARVQLQRQAFSEVGVVFVLAAVHSGRTSEAAAWIDALAKQTGRAELAAIATRLRSTP